MNNKRGISTIVVSIIMIVIVLGAIGLVWVVINQILEGSTGEIAKTTLCLKVNVVATALVCEDTTCDVTLNRKAGGEDIGGVKLIFSNSVSGNVGETVEDFAGNIPELGTKVVKDKAHGLTDEQPDTVEVAVYFTDASGKNSICSQTREFKF